MLLILRAFPLIFFTLYVLFYLLKQINSSASVVLCVNLRYLRETMLFTLLHLIYELPS